MTDPNKNWNRLDNETKDKVVSSYFNIKNETIRKDIENLYGYDNLIEYDNQRKNNRTH